MGELVQAAVRRAQAKKHMAIEDLCAYGASVADIHDACAIEHEAFEEVMQRELGESPRTAWRLLEIGNHYKAAMVTDGQDSMPAVPEGAPVSISGYAALLASPEEVQQAVESGRVKSTRDAIEKATKQIRAERDRAMAKLAIVEAEQRMTTAVSAEELAAAREDRDLWQAKSEKDEQQRKEAEAKHQRLEEGIRQKADLPAMLFNWRQKATLFQAQLSDMWRECPSVEETNQFTEFEWALLSNIARNLTEATAKYRRLLPDYAAIEAGTRVIDAGDVEGVEDGTVAPD